jgi:peptide-methionine (S)-S-oxide reductase
MFFTKSNPQSLVSLTLKGRTEKMIVSQVHTVLKNPVHWEGQAHLAIAWFGMGCFWGAERLFWRQAGVYATSVGYGGGQTPNPTYQEVCSGQTNHIELVQVIYDPQLISYAQLLKCFWENHDPTQGMRQGGDVGTQYRSALFCATQAQYELAISSQHIFTASLKQAGQSASITTEIRLFQGDDFYFAEDYHQQYLDKKPDGYCGLKGTGVKCILS